MLVCCYGFVEKIKNIYVKKNYCYLQCFQGKNYKAKFSISLILKKINKNIKNNKIDKDNFEKNHVEEHCSNLQCKRNSQPAQY